MGLYIISWILGSNGGKVKVNSEPRKGSHSILFPMLI